MTDSTLTCYNNGIDTEEHLPNKHLDHLEDLIFVGRKEALNAVRTALSKPKLSVKWDGAPAIVFGTNPANGKFFVGTKSVFNKVKVKICYSQEDIDQLYKGNVADILRLCLHNLPRLSGIFQADFIGVGGGSVYRPNTLEYRFSTPTSRDIILAPHTSYTEVSPTADGRGGVNLLSALGTHFVGLDEANAKIRKNPKFNWIKFLFMLTQCKIPSASARPHIYKHINKFIRSGSLPSAEVLCDTLPDKYKCEVNQTTFQVWYMIFLLKQSLLSNIVVDGTVKCFLNGKPAQHEGFVTVSDKPYKIVDRLTFSKANFNLDKNWTNEKI
jgi:hypothetical protein